MRFIPYFVLVFVGAGAALAQDEEAAASGPGVLASGSRTSTIADRLDTVFVMGRPSVMPRVGGSTHFLGQEQLEQFESTDVHNVLQRVPGVYIRAEDGYGLRPNIGIRGANPDRSSKVTLLEDGILLGPGPYSAPAAYYFPMMMRVVGVEVFMGPSAILQGPQTVGGALNFQTRSIPTGLESEIDVALGIDRLGKLHGLAGYGEKNWGVLVEGSHLQTDGFRELDGGGNTGFARTDLMLKARVGTDPLAEVSHQVELKAGYGAEVSNETYLGATLEDFRENPMRRYIGSAEDLMEWERFQAQIAYRLTSDDVRVRLTAYRHDLERDWRRFDRLGPSAPQVGGEVLRRPNTPGNRPFYEILTGQENSGSALSERLIIANNVRRYVSQGIDLTGSWSLNELFGFLDQELRFGVRLHNDSIERDHVDDSLLVLNRTLVPDGSVGLQAADNRGEAWALAAFLQADWTIGPLTLTPGLRMERIETQFQDRLDGRRIDDEQFVLLPGFGAHFAVLPWLGVFAGAHVGFSAVAPGQAADVEPERAVGYEGGFRLNTGDSRLEVVGFLSDYSNIVGDCTASSGGCPGSGELNQQFNGGEALIYGLELAASQGVALPYELRFDVSVNYTYTRAEFQTGFVSGFGQWGRVDPGDQLPYVPEHAFGSTARLLHPKFELNLGVRAMSAVRDEAGQQEDDLKTDAYAVLDALAAYRFVPEGSIYVRADNLLDAQYIVAFRPFGARPGPPLQAQIGYRHRFQ